MRKIIYFLILILNIPLSLLGQKVTLSGVVRDNNNGETLAGVYVMLRDTLRGGTPQGSITNSAGFYSITIEQGSYKLTVESLGYEEIAETIVMKSNRTRNFDLNPKVFKAEGITISAQKEDKNVTAVDVGKVDMKIEAIKSLPAFMGEVDVLKSIQLLPGIQSGSEGNSGFFVRGGNSDQNLILLDGATVYNAGHLFGFFSVFNADAVKNVEIFKSGMPAQYGGRLASIIDVTQNDGNMKRWQLDAGIGLVFSGFTVQGPLKRDKCAVIVSARRTYADFLIQPFLKKDSPMKGSKFYFYDLNAKISWNINDKHRLTASGYYGNDVYGFKSNSGALNTQFQWGNAAASLRWQWILAPRLFLNTTASFSNYNLDTKMGIDAYSAAIVSGIRDYSLKSQLTFLPNPKHTLNFGAHYTFHVFFPSRFEVETGAVDEEFSLNEQKPFYANELAIYANDEYDIAKWLKINIGLRYTHFSHVGRFTRYHLDNFGYICDSTTYKPGEIISQYNNVEPRFSARFLLDKNTSIKISYTMNHQYVHQIAMANISLPTDIWMPSTSIIKPQIGHQVSLGVYRNFYDNMFETYIDAYYKNMKNLAEYKEGLDLASVNINADQLYTFGKGYSWGIEFFVKKTRGRFTGFIGYTLAYSKRQFDALNNGEWFNAKYDRRHDLTITLSYEILPSKLTASAVWIYATGNTMTIPVGFYFFNGSLITEYSDRNAYRLPPYHRLDLSLTWNIAKRKHFDTSLSLSIYNVYNRKNPFYIFYETQTEFDTNIIPPHIEFNTTAYQISLFPIIPTITWNFKIK